MVLKRVRHARRAQDVLRPLFPGYVFVAVDPDLHRWRPILSTFGVRTLMRSGRPSLLSDALHQGIKAREMDGAIVRPDTPYKLGQQVRVSGGAFDGLVATIIAMDEKDRLVVLMELLNRPVKVRSMPVWWPPPDRLLRKSAVLQEGVGNARFGSNFGLRAHSGRRGAQACQTKLP